MEVNVRSVPPAGDLSLSRQHLVALAPNDLPQAQARLTQWLIGKRREVAAEIRDLAENVTVAERNQWRSSGLRSALSRARGRFIYYSKLKAAVDDGYLIIPNLDIDVMAVRVDRERPPAVETTAEREAYSAAPTVRLPPGEGRYVDDAQFARVRVEKDPRGDGSNTYDRRFYTPSRYETTVDFPVTLVKPVILEATARAMAQRIFDRIGVAGVSGRRRGDPMVVGQILSPKVGWGSQKIVTFFIAWWLDTRALEI